MSKGADPLVFAAVVFVSVAAGAFLLRRVAATRIVAQGSGRIVNNGYVSGVVNPYTGAFITGEDMGRIDWGV